MSNRPRGRLAVRYDRRMLSLRFSFAARAGGLALLLAACGDNGGTSGSAGLTDSGGASSTGAGSSSTNPSGTVSDSATSEPGSGSDSMTSQTATEPTSSTSVTSGPSTTDGTASTTDPGTSTTGSTGAVSTDTGGSTSDTTGAVSGSTGDGSTGTSTTGPDCMPVAETCNDLDDDCNGIVDDLDVGNDGFCDCLNIALFGNKGANPAAQFEAWLEAQGTQVDRIQTTNVPLDQATLDKYDIIILDRLIRTYTPQEATLMSNWVGVGGGLMSMTGYTGAPPDVNNPNSLIGPMGLTYNNSKGIISGPVTSWMMHPISMGITSVTFLGGFYINIMDDGVGTNTVVATLPQGPVAVAQERKGGKLFIWGDEWIEFDSEWQNQPQIKKFWANILAWLSPQNFCTVPQ
jgi:hypothetical protein